MTTTRKIRFSLIASILLATFSVGLANAQHLISSRAGFVNRIQGKVYIIRQDTAEQEKGRASQGTQMKDGDLLGTESDSFAELLLNPGSYLRLNTNSKVRAINTNLSEVRFELISGSVIVEVGEVVKNAPIEIVTSRGSLFITKDGLHRINMAGEIVSVAIRQGDLYFGLRDEVIAKKAVKVGRGKIATLNGAPQPLLSKINKDAIDDFDIWSFNRAQTLMAANNRALVQTGTSLAYGWFYDPFFGCYTFIPRRGMFYSPYGFGFFRNIGDCFTCNGGWPYGYGSYGGYYGGWPSGGGSHNNGNANTPGKLPARVVAGVDRAPVRREMEGRRIDSGFGSDTNSRGGFDNFGGSSRSTSSPPVQSSPAQSAPAPAPSRSTGGDGGARPSMPTRPVQ